MAAHAQSSEAALNPEEARTASVPIAGLLKAATAPVAPSAPGARDMTSSSITWTWTDNSSDETGFKVWADPGAGSPATLQIITAAGATSWRQPGLLANTLYSFQVASTAVYLDSARTAPYSAWTQAAKPAAPVVGNPRKTSLDVAVAGADGNPDGTEYAMMCATTGQWITGTGTLSTSPEYHTGTAWGTVTVAGLTPATSYSFVAVARNGVGAVTAAGAASKGSTLTTVPGVVSMTRIQAQSAVNGAKLLAGIITETYNNVIPAGTVISQTPAAGTDAVPGTEVDLVVSIGPAPVAVPNLIGLSRVQAQAAVTGALLSIGSVGEEYSSTVPAGSVSFQLPSAGAQIAGGSAVSFTVSRGPAPVLVPSFTGLTRVQAEAAVTAAGLDIGTETEAFSGTVSPGIVMTQNPAAGWFVSAGTEVALTVSKGPATTVVVPNVVGMARSQAQSALTSVLLAVGVEADAYSSTLAAGTVLSQYPAPGTEIPSGTAVNLVVIRGVAPVPVPSVVSLTREQASSNLSAAGLALGSVTETYSAKIAAGRVISQNPATGVEVAPGTAVSVVVSLGTTQTMVPNVVGTTRNMAEYSLINAGLIMGSVTLGTSAAVAPGEIISQNPAAGAQVSAGSSVSLVINRSSESEQVEVPEAVGLALAQAKSVVTGASLTVGAVSEAASDTVAAGVVMEQNPASGTIMVADAAVDLVVSSGPDSGGCLGCNSQKSALPSVKKAFNDFFLMGLSLVTLLAVNRNKI